VTFIPECLYFLFLFSGLFFLAPLEQKMKVKTSLAKAKKEMEKSIKAKSFSKNFVHSFIAVIAAIFHVLKRFFSKVYLAIYTRLNKILPLPFQGF